MTGTPTIPTAIVERINREFTGTTALLRLLSNRTDPSSTEQRKALESKINWLIRNRHGGGVTMDNVCFFYLEDTPHPTVISAQSDLRMRKIVGLLFDSHQDKDFYLAFMLHCSRSKLPSGVPCFTAIDQAHKQPEGIYSDLDLDEKYIAALVEYRKLKGDDSWRNVHVSQKAPDTTNKHRSDFNLSALSAYPFQYKTAELTHPEDKADLSVTLTRYKDIVSAVSSKTIKTYKDLTHLLSGQYLKTQMAGDAGQFLPLLTLVGAPDAMRLYKSGALSFEQRDKFGNAPLHLMAMNGDIESIQQAISAGADINIRNAEGATPLHFFVENLCLRTTTDPSASDLMRQYLDLRPNVKAQTTTDHPDDALSHMTRLLNINHDFSAQATELQSVARLLKQAGCDVAASSAKVTSRQNILFGLDFESTVAYTATPLAATEPPAAEEKLPAIGALPALLAAADNIMVETLAAYDLSTLPNGEQTQLINHVIQSNHGGMIIRKFPASHPKLFEPAASTNSLTLMASLISQGCRLDGVNLGEFTAGDIASASFGMMIDEIIRQAKLILKFVNENPRDLNQVTHAFIANSIGFELSRLSKEIIASDDNATIYTDYQKIITLLDSRYATEKSKLDKAKNLAALSTPKNTHIISKTTKEAGLTDKQNTLNKLFRAFLNKDLSDAGNHPHGFILDLETHGNVAAAASGTSSASSSRRLDAQACAGNPPAPFAPPLPITASTKPDSLLAMVAQLLSTDPEGVFTEALLEAMKEAPAAHPAIVESANAIQFRRLAARSDRPTTDPSNAGNPTPITRTAVGTMEPVESVDNEFDPH